MEIVYAIWAFLWDNQAVIAFVIIFLLWFFVRGYDLFRWIFRKLRGRSKKKAE